MTNHQIGVALAKIAKLLGSFATQLMVADNKVVQLKPKASVSAATAMKLPPKTKLGDLPVTTVKLSKRHATIVAKFRKMGIKNPQLFTDIKTFDLWSKDGFVPKKGQHGVHGLFHRSQVQPVG